MRELSIFWYQFLDMSGQVFVVYFLYMKWKCVARLKWHLQEQNRDECGSGDSSCQCIIVTLIINCHVKWVHLLPRHGADRGDGLQICRVAENILNKQSRTAHSGLSSSRLDVRRGLRTLARKTHYLLRINTHSLRTGRITWHNLCTGKWTWDLVHGMLGAYIGQVNWKR
jgi:hypothetical protein